MSDTTPITTFNFTKGSDNWHPISDLNSLSLNDFNTSKSTVQVMAYNNEVYITNVTSKTKVNIYSITGALVKSLETNIDTSFNFKNGLWIVTIKDANGQKAVKLVTH